MTLLALAEAGYIGEDVGSQQDQFTARIEDRGAGKSKVSVGIRFFPRKYFFFIDECLSRVMHTDSLWVLPLVTVGGGGVM